MWKKQQQPPTKPLRQWEKVSTDIKVGGQEPSRNEVPPSHVWADLCEGVWNQEREWPMGTPSFAFCRINKMYSRIQYPVLHWPLMPGTKQAGFSCVDSPGVRSVAVCVFWAKQWWHLPWVSSRGRRLQFYPRLVGLYCPNVQCVSCYFQKFQNNLTCSGGRRECWLSASSHMLCDDISGFDL